MDNRSYWITVRCNRCKELIRTRVDLMNDLSIEYGESDNDTTYFCRKMIMGDGQCFQQIEVELTFDKNHKLINQTIKGGQFVEPEG